MPRRHRTPAQTATVALCILALSVSIGCQTVMKTASKTKEKTKPGEKPPPNEMDLTPTSDFRIRASVKAWRTMGRENIVMQGLDYSCGSASLATLLKYYLEDDVREADVLEVIFKRLATSEDPKAAIEDRIKNGFSLLDLLYAAKDLGYLGGVVRISLPKMAKIEAPALVKIEKMNYHHFVIFRGVHDGRVYLADPTRGHVRLSVEEFVKQWSGESLYIGKKDLSKPTDYPLALQKEGPSQPEMEMARQAILSPRY